MDYKSPAPLGMVPIGRRSGVNKAALGHQTVIFFSGKGCPAYTKLIPSTLSLGIGLKVILGTKLARGGGEVLT